MDPLSSSSGPVAVVTGGARGIGLAIGRWFLARDYRVALAKTWNGGWNASAAVVGANNNAFFRPTTGGLSLANGDTRELNKPVVVLQVGRSF